MGKIVFLSKEGRRVCIVASVGKTLRRMEFLSRGWFGTNDCRGAKFLFNCNRHDESSLVF